jgi:hypothetical protein
MYASIQRYDHVTARPDEMMPAGRRLAAALRRVPGFVAYVLLAIGEGQYVALSLFEDEAGRATAEGLTALGKWLPTEHSPAPAAHPCVTGGEVVIQIGL